MEATKAGCSTGGMKTANDDCGSEGKSTGVKNIRERMDVIASCGKKVGVIDHVEGDALKLTRKDSPDGRHHYIPASWVDHVDRHVQLVEHLEHPDVRRAAGTTARKHQPDAQTRALRAARRRGTRCSICRCLGADGAWLRSDGDGLRGDADEHGGRQNNCFRGRHALATACHRRRLDLSTGMRGGYRSAGTCLKLARMGYSRIVDEDVDATESRFNLCDHAFHIGGD